MFLKLSSRSDKAGDTLQEVLQQLTIPNALVASSIGSDQNSSPNVLTPEGFSAVSRRARFLGGDWRALVAQDNQQSLSGYDIVLSADTLYRKVCTATDEACGRLKLLTPHRNNRTALKI